MTEFAPQNAWEDITFSAKLLLRELTHYCGPYPELPGQGRDKNDLAIAAHGNKDLLVFFI